MTVSANMEKNMEIYENPHQGIDGSARKYELEPTASLRKFAYEILYNGFYMHDEPMIKNAVAPLHEANQKAGILLPHEQYVSLEEGQKIVIMKLEEHIEKLKNKIHKMHEAIPFHDLNKAQIKRIEDIYFDMSE